jgi:hypothetical protein
MEKDMDVFAPVQAVQWTNDASGGYGDGTGWFYGQNPPSGARLAYWLKADAAEVTVEILDASGTVVGCVPNADRARGVNVVYWNFRGGGVGGGGGRGGGGQFGQVSGPGLRSPSYRRRQVSNEDVRGHRRPPAGRPNFRVLRVFPVC